LSSPDAGTAAGGKLWSATPEEATEEIAELEDELSAEKAKSAGLEADVADLEAEITALKAPGEVQRWEPACWAGAGVFWDALNLTCDYITEMSDGRIVATASAPGAVCPVEEQMDAVALGTTEAMCTSLSYAGGKVPVTYVACRGAEVPRSPAELRHLLEIYQGGRIRELCSIGMAEYGDIHLVGNVYAPGGDILASTIPVYGIADLEGLTTRCHTEQAKAFTALGAAAVYIPGSEIYTALATGTLDATIWGNVTEDVAISLQEVTQYWVSKPLLGGPYGETFLVNGTVWAGLSDDLKAIVEAAVQVGSLYNFTTTQAATPKTWKFVEDYGIEIIEWPEEDCARYAEELKAAFATRGEEIEDARFDEAMAIVAEWAAEAGY